MISIRCRNRMLNYRLWILLAFFLAACSWSPSGPPLDPYIEDLKLTKLVTGDEAIKAIDKLHGRPINVVRGFIAHYEGVHDKATIWVSEPTSQELAQKQLAVMLHKMKSNRRLPFRNYRVLDTQGIRVIAFDGTEQIHYIFRDNKWVYWISADTNRIDKILRHILKSR